MLVAVSILAVSCATTSILRNRPRSRLVASLPNHFEAVGLDSAPVQGKDRERLERTFLNNENLSILRFFQKDWVSIWIRGKPSRVWRRCATHPYLAEVFPGVEFYSVEVGEVDSSDWFPRLMQTLEVAVAVRDSSSHLLPYELNQLMVDADWRVDSTDVERWVRVYALLWAMMKRGTRSGKAIRSMNEYWSLPFFPEIDMDNVVVKWRNPKEPPLVSAAFRTQDGSTTEYYFLVTFCGGLEGPVWLVPRSLYGGGEPHLDEGPTHYFLELPRTESFEKNEP